MTCWADSAEQVKLLALLPNIDGPNLVRVAERIRREIADLVLPVQANRDTILFRGLTASIGIAQYPRHGEILEQLIRAADNVLLTAKEPGPDQIQFAGALGLASARPDPYPAEPAASGIEPAVLDVKREAENASETGQVITLTEVSSASGPTAQEIMWARFLCGQERGRIPTGAELDRVAGRNNYGRTVLRQGCGMTTELPASHPARRVGPACGCRGCPCRRVPAAGTTAAPAHGPRRPVR